MHHPSSSSSFSPSDELPGSSNNNSPLKVSLSSIVGELKDKFKSEDGQYQSPFQDLDKASVLQETKLFSDAQMVTRHPRKCCQLITKLLHILTQGEPFTSTETTDVFFGVTKLFQSKDANLRRMMYLFIKEVAEATKADEVCFRLDLGFFVAGMIRWKPPPTCSRVIQPSRIECSKRDELNIQI